MGVGGPDPLKICRTGFDPFPKISHSFSQNCCLITLRGSHRVHIVKDERLLSKMEGKTNFSRRMKQFDGLTRVTPNLLISRQIYATVFGTNVYQVPQKVIP